MISVRTLSKKHGERTILSGVSAEVAKGETIAIVGPSGRGKSTLLRCMNYLETFEEGEIAIAGVTLRPGMGVRDRETLRGLRVKVGMVFQQFNLFPHPFSSPEGEGIQPSPRETLTNGKAALEPALSASFNGQVRFV